MEEELKNLSSEEIIELYNVNKTFISFLEKEQKNAERMREGNE